MIKHSLTELSMQNHYVWALFIILLYVSRKEFSLHDVILYNEMQHVFLPSTIYWMSKIK